MRRWSKQEEQKLMIFGAHVIVYSKDATADRAFFKKVLGFSSVDAGGGWLIFALPPAELGIHPAAGSSRQALYLMCDDIEATIRELAARAVALTRPVSDARVGLVPATTISASHLVRYIP